MSAREPALRQVADGVYAYLQSGGWGYSNAGLITSGRASLLIDTLYDESLTRQMLGTLQTLRPTPLAVDTVVNTHANGDHCWGNAAVPDAKIISSKRAADEMRELPPRAMHGLVRASALLAHNGLSRRVLRLLTRLHVPQAGALLEAAPFVAEKFGPFDFRRVRLRLPDAAFSAELWLELEGRRVLLQELGPAHTRGDVIAYIPDARVVFTGDLLFAGSHPIAWAGPIEGWIAACDRMLALDADVIVPGHGPLATKREIADTKRYWEQLLAGARGAIAAGLDIESCARALAADWKLDWREESRLVVNVYTAYRTLSPATRKRTPLELLAAMARYERSH